MSSGATEDGSAQKKQRTEDFFNTIVIKFTNNKDDKTFYCTVKRTTTFRKVFQTYCHHHNLQDDSVRFLFEDRKILPNLTPADINFPDGGEIDVMPHIDGGGCHGLVILQL
ncbi:hypothetical protein RND81_05G168900 [Saponaria officinalis]|uniref:Rad60/SUMO-like domain-containing protein n=1 Tax=Saponaria officinalis TaxID=3572 RepID=A0AAW1KWP9_SAPOF